VVAIPQPKRDLLAVSYSAAHFGKSLLWYMIELLFGFFLAEIYGIPPRTLGLLLAAFLLWDAVTDPVVALAVARRPVTTQSLLRIQFVGAILSGVAFWLVFLNPVRQGISSVSYAFFVGILFRSAYSILDVPQNVLLKRLSSTPARRLTLSSLRTALSALATLTVSVASATILEESNFASRSTHFALVAALFAITAAGTAGWVMIAGRTADFAEPTGSADLRTTLRATLLDRRLLVLFLAMFFLSLGWPLFGKLVPFFASYVRGSPAATGAYIATTAIAALVSQPLWIVLGNRLTRRSAIGLAFVTMTAGAIIFLLAARSSAVGCLFGVAVMSSGASALSLLIWTRMADRLSDQALSQANDVLAFGLFTFASKLALSIGGLLLGGVLLVAHYVPGAKMANGDQRLMVMQMIAYPLASALVAAILASVEDVDNETL
jgi:glycoside/pentoside/hexuronide:cation symporter, GPH family